MKIRRAELADAEGIAAIYNHHILTSIATFELEPIESTEMGARIRDAIDRGFPFLVAEDKAEICGYAYGHQFRPRQAYQQTIEVSVYVKHGCEGRGVASELYGKLIPQIVTDGYHSVVAVIALPNDASVRLHEKFGFEKVGHFHEVGRKFDRWIDVGYWQLSRSKANQNSTA